PKAASIISTMSKKGICLLAGSPKRRATGGDMGFRDTSGLALSTPRVIVSFHLPRTDGGCPRYSHSRSAADRRLLGARRGGAAANGQGRGRDRGVLLIGELSGIDMMQEPKSTGRGQILDRHPEGGEARAPPFELRRIAKADEREVAGDGDLHLVQRLQNGLGDADCPGDQRSRRVGAGQQLLDRVAAVWGDRGRAENLDRLAAVNAHFLKGPAKSRPPRRSGRELKRAANIRSEEHTS